MPSWKEKYPKTKFINNIENFHGTEINDGYRWLENVSDPEVLAWGNKQNKITDKFLDSPIKEQIKEELTSILKYQKISPIRKAGDFYYYFRTTDLNPQPILYRSKILNFENIEEMSEEIVIDPNKLSEDGTIAITGFSLNKKGSSLAYRYSISGSDWQTIKIFDLKEQNILPDTIKDIKFTQIAWTKDNKGFFYSKYPSEGSVPNEERNFNNKLYYHKLHTSQETDKLIYEDLTNKKLFFNPQMSCDQNFVVIEAYDSTMPLNKLYIYDIINNEMKKIFDKSDALYRYIGNVNKDFYVLTNKKSPNKKIVKFNAFNASIWTEIVSETQNNLIIAKMTKNYLTLVYLENTVSKAMIVNLNGVIHWKVDLPVGTISERIPNEIQKDFLSDMVYFQFECFNIPESIYQLDIKNKKLNIIYKPSIFGVDLDNIEVKQIFYESKDKTKIPMFIIHRKDLSINGNIPTLLYGYGGFNISLSPFFRIFGAYWMLHGILAVPNLRGGNEYGEKWHKDGILENKQNVFDDFISSAEYLINNNYTNTKKLAIMGASNGGLLTAACVVQRPDLFGSVIVLNAVIDMLRYHKFSIGYFWMPEYGDPANSDHFNFIIKYSPLHNVKEGQTYPPIFVKVADTDDRVVPAHGKKFIASMQASDSGENPILLSIETKAGHGLGKPTTKLIEEYTNIFTFLMKTLNFNPYPNKIKFSIS